MKCGGGNREMVERILIVDDEPLVRDVLTRRLEESGYICISVPDGFEAIKQLSAREIDLMLLDINMPGKSGLEVLKEIQTTYSDVVTIMTTAVTDIKVAIDAMRSGAYDYIIKPIDLDILTLSVERGLEKRKLLQENKQYQQYLEEKVKEQTRLIRESFVNEITAMAFALEAKDHYTHGHSEKTTRIAIAIATEIGISGGYIEKIRVAGLLHDIGKIGIKESILNKEGSLTAEEFEIVKTHPKIGEKILIPIVQDDEILDMVCHHHERYDGKGYPDGLRANQISLGARIMAVADSFEAMIGDRPYRKALKEQVVFKELENGKNTQFDAVVVDALIKVLKENKLNISIPV
jgi:putative two-component system response regulator